MSDSGRLLHMERRSVTYEARHYDRGVLYMQLESGHDTKTWCFYSERGGSFVGKVGYPWIEPVKPYLTVPVTREAFRRRYDGAQD